MEDSSTTESASACSMSSSWDNHNCGSENNNNDDDDSKDDGDGDEDEDENSTLGIHALDYHLRVMTPKTRTTLGQQEYTTYCIAFQTSSAAFRLPRSKTWRRFSEFVWLRKELDKVDNWQKPPVLPAKRFWNVLEPKFVETRRRQLEQWLHEVLSEPLYLSNAALHLFLQTEMTLESIQRYMEGKTAESDMEEIWGNMGKLYHYQAHNILHNSFHQDPLEIHCSVGIRQHEQQHQQHLDIQTSPTQDASQHS